MFFCCMFHVAIMCPLCCFCPCFDVCIACIVLVYGVTYYVLYTVLQYCVLYTVLLIPLYTLLVFVDVQRFDPEERRFINKIPYPYP